MANKKVSQLVSKPSVLVTDLFPIADPTTGQLFKTTISDLGTAIGSGVSSVNGLVGAVVLDTDDIQELASPTNRWFTDTRARAALSASSPLAYNSGTGVFSIPQADGSTNGFLSSADWTTFNAKQAALSGTGFVKISGTTISYDNSTYLTTSGAASTYLALSGGTLTGALNGTSATFSGDLTLSATNPRLYFTDTDNNPDYFISNTDGTFTIYDVTNSTSRFTIGTTGNGTFGGNLTVGQIIRSGGTSSQFLKADGSVDSTAYLPLAGGTLTGALFATSASFSGFVGFGGNTSPLAAIDVTGAGIFSSSVRSSGYYLTGMTSGSGALYYNSGANRVTVANYNTNGIVLFEVNGGSTALTLNSNLSATFAGAISGTSASFSSSVTANNLVIRNSGVPAAQFFRDLDVVSVGSAGQGIEFGARSGSTYIAGAAIYGGLDNPATTGNLVFQTLNGGSLGTRLTIASTGAATFSSSVTANSTNGVAGVFKSDTFFGSIDLENTGGTATGKWNVQAVSGAQIGGSAGSSFGIYSYGASAYRMFINSSGNVGIGTTAPGSRLQVNDTSTCSIRIKGNSVTGFDLQNDIDGAYLWNRDNTPIYFATNNTERMRITSGGNVGIGTTSPVGAETNDLVLQLNGNSTSAMRSMLRFTNGNSGSTWGNGTFLGIDSTLDFYIANLESANLLFQTSGSERMRITSGGEVLVNTTSTGGGFVNASKFASYQGYTTDSNTTTISTQRTAGLFAVDAGNNSNNQGSYCAIVGVASWGASSNPGAIFRGYQNNTLSVQINYNGNLTNTNNSYGAISDISLKENITDTTNKLTDLLKVKIRNYNLIGNSEKQIGVIAQELEQVFPKMIETNSEGLKSVKYSVFVPMLIKAVQELSDKITTLENK